MFRIFAIATLAVAALMGTSSSTALAGDCCCCPPPPKQVELCVQPPCSCCPQTVCVCVPGCCCVEPTVCWKKGICGRQIGTYTWCDCGHSVKVVVTKRGKVRVRG